MVRMPECLARLSAVPVALKVVLVIRLPAKEVLRRQTVGISAPLTRRRTERAASDQGGHHKINILAFGYRFQNYTFAFVGVANFLW